VSAGTRRLTYAALAGQATQLAHALRRLGVGAEVRVGVCLERSVELVVGFLGILKAGGAYVPLDPAYPPERLTYLASDAELPVILTTSSLLSRLPDLPRCTMCCLDLEAERLAEESPEALSGPTLDQLAYTIYTSGSTGQPKGVEILHRGVLNMALWHRDTFGLTAADRVTQLVSPSFDVAGAELWPALIAGACVCIPDEETRLAPAALRDWLLAQHITLTILPTPLAERVLALPWPEEGALRWLLTGGDILRHYPAPGLPFTLVNNYGPTEASVVATATRVEPLDAPECPPSIGRPIANTQIYLLDQHRQLVPIGVPGELHIGGIGLARGYLQRPELTEARFLPHPFSQAKGARLYKTGDLARYRPDGTLEFLGRLDNQVKVRGFRIEPGEIEAVLARHPSIAEAVVLAREDLAGEKMLIAYVVAGESLSLSASDLRTFVLESLPEYMVPARFVWLEQLPLTPNGKVDRKTLPQQAQADLHLTTPFVPPRHVVEEQLAALWAEVLDLPVERVGIHDDFFALGGHSLRATQLLARVQATFQVELPLRAVFAAPTIAGLLEQLAQSAADQADEQTLTAVLAELAQEGASEIPALPSSKELNYE
jgi:amino acid adenylation domain-containing protein